MIRNLVEEHVRESYDGVVRRFQDFCGCEICREDVLVFALNRIPARYVTSLEGQAVSGVALERDQERTVIDVAVLEGVRRVGSSPRCGRKSRPT